MRNLGDIVRDEMVMRDRILEVLELQPRSIPDIAEILKQPAHEVMIWVMTMWRYGIVTETGKADENGFYQYQTKA
jgi:hypothetical protein